MKKETLFKFWMENRLYTAKCASLRTCHSFQFITISENFAIINKSVNTAQLISYLHHLYTLFIKIGGFASRASRTLDWTWTLTFWAVSGFCLTKAPLIGHCVTEINRYASDMLQCTTLQKRVQTQIQIRFWPEAAAGYFHFVVYVYLVASFLSLELGYMHPFSLNPPLGLATQGLKTTVLESFIFIQCLRHFSLSYEWYKCCTLLNYISSLTQAFVNAAVSVVAVSDIFFLFFHFLSLIFCCQAMAWDTVATLWNN